MAEVGEGVQQPGEAEKEEEVLEQQQQQKQQEQQQQAVGESQCESECEPKEEKEEECQPNTAQSEETTIPKGLDDNSKIHRIFVIFKDTQQKSYKSPYQDQWFSCWFQSMVWCLKKTFLISIEENTSN